MDWASALSAFMKDHWSDMGQREFEAMYGYPWDHFSISGLWSYRGKIWAKYAGSYPKPSEVGLEASHDFFNPDYVCHERWRNADGKILKEAWYHHGRKMKPTHRLWASRPAPTICRGPGVGLRP